jgi:AcrR family transcriptional regulator
MARPRSQLNLSALTDAFASDGLHGISATELAAAVGVAKPTLYAHGTSKEALFLAAIESEVERVADRLQAAEAATVGRCAHDRATAVAHALLNHAAARPEGTRLLCHTAHHSASDVAAAAAAALNRVPNRITQMLRHDLKADNLDPSLAPFMARALYASAFALGGPVSGRRPARERLARLAASVVPLPPSVPAEEWPSA